MRACVVCLLKCRQLSGCKWIHSRLAVKPLVSGKVSGIAAIQNMLLGYSTKRQKSARSSKREKHFGSLILLIDIVCLQGMVS